ncbi:MAG: rod-binding protein [Pseudomonadota bacterium]
MDLDIIGQNMASARAEAVKQTPATSKNKAALKEACQGFEAIFLATLLKSMRATVSESKLFGESQGMDIFRSMQDQALAEDLSRGSNTTGLGEILYKALQNSVK